MIKTAFASGKGGAGKTSLSLSFHKFIKEKSVFADCDVDAADAFLLIEKEKTEQRPFISGYKYSITDQCCGCGACADVCVFNAVKNEGGDYSIEPLHCEGCGACEDVCPAGSIVRNDNRCGELFVSETRFDSKMVYARLIPGEDNSGKLVYEVRKSAQQLTVETSKEYLVIDCPPGIGCPLIASITGIDFLVVIIECSRAGFSDAKRLMEVAGRFRIPMAAILNKSGINPEIDEEIELFLQEQSVVSAGSIPFNEEIVNILNRKELLIDSKSLSADMNLIYSRIIEIISQRGK